MPRKQNTLKDGFWDTFPTKLRKLFDDTKKTQQELADYLGLKSRQSITSYTDGSSSPSWQSITKIAEFFGVSTDYLLTETDVKSVDPELRAVCKYTGLSETAVSALREYEVDVDIINFMLENSIVGGFSEISYYLRYTLVDRKYIIDSLGNVEPIYDMNLALERMEEMKKKYAPDAQYAAETVNIGEVVYKRSEEDVLSALGRLRGIYQAQGKDCGNG